MATLNVKYQHRLQGPPSSHASTHIYDGFISKIKYDGLLTCGFGISQVLRFKKLVRIGGGCCEPELEQYRERDVAFSDLTWMARGRGVGTSSASYEVDDEFEDALEAIEEAEEGKDSAWMSSERSLVAPHLWRWDMSLGERWTLSAVTTAPRQASQLITKAGQSANYRWSFDPLEAVTEGDSSNFRSYGLNVQCTHEVVYARCCGHLWSSRGQGTLLIKAVLKACEAPVRFRRTSTCGHDIEMKGCDAFKIVQVEETASACTARVLKPLDCAHKVAMECSQWKQSPGAMQRVSKLRTVHPRNGMAGHSFFLRLCSSTTRLQTVIKGTQRVLSDKSLTLYVVEYSQQAGLSRSEAEVAGTIQRRHRFELKTLNEENFLRIAGSEKAHVVFGHLYSAKYLINPVDIPTSKGKKSTANIRAWVTRQSSRGYDALYLSRYEREAAAGLSDIDPSSRSHGGESNQHTTVSSRQDASQAASTDHCL
ncbi:hypothetical protein PC129_g18407 [Phytophthora cactorum]|uniref:Uncharacterized protein n=2 Tax=Phytophthora cactorum TaxID=29920 RepID=A0A8T1JZF2_9STRA|nr:hypothetical protein PC114_g20810 [Phytophthora cactorum]KAG2906455.1 hypothetical protein PC117_g20512 [Phytophthora cactorum]KAG3210597.1 hypothetical protein PC129_g18407 [Phytophthora cactorum]KAG4228722.1 hypothetical protein PC116_g22936 [Phytophthora cactorum]